MGLMKDAGDENEWRPARFMNAHPELFIAAGHKILLPEQIEALKRRVLFVRPARYKLNVEHVVCDGLIYEVRNEADPLGRAHPSVCEHQILTD